MRQAIDLLVGRRDELVTELGEVSTALRALGYDPSHGASEPAPAARDASARDMSTPSHDLARRPAVRAAVADLLDLEPQTHHLDEVVTTLRPSYPDRDEAKFRANVRSALWQLKESNSAISPSRGLYRSAKWAADAEDPAVEAGSSDLSALDAKGGGGSDGAGVPEDAVACISR